MSRRPDYNTSRDPSIAVDHLAVDPLSHAWSLKMLSLHRDACVSTTYENSDGWACVTEMEAEASRWDRTAYPSAKRLITFDGNSELLLRIAFEETSKARSVLKIHEPITRSLVANGAGYHLAQTFLSYSTDGTTWKDQETSTGVTEHHELDENAERLLSENGYTGQELAEYFRDRASWFGLTIGSRCVSACLVYRNYRDIWEIGGVYTVAEERGKGYAKAVVRSATRTLLHSRRTPRYVFRSDNEASRAVAEGVGLKHDVTIEHFIAGE